MSIFPLAQTQAADLAELLFGSFCVRSPGHPARGLLPFLAATRTAARSTVAAKATATTVRPKVTHRGQITHVYASQIRAPRCILNYPSTNASAVRQPCTTRLQDSEAWTASRAWFNCVIPRER